MVDIIELIICMIKIFDDASFFVFFFELYDDLLIMKILMEFGVVIVFDYVILV